MVTKEEDGAEKHALNRQFGSEAEHEAEQGATGVNRTELEDGDGELDRGGLVPGGYESRMMHQQHQMQPPHHHQQHHHHQQQQPQQQAIMGPPQLPPPFVLPGYFPQSGFQQGQQQYFVVPVNFQPGLGQMGPNNNTQSVEEPVTLPLAVGPDISQEGGDGEDERERNNGDDEDKVEKGTAKSSSGAESEYNGVYWDSEMEKWHAVYTNVWDLGYFDSQEEAAVAIDLKTIEMRDVLKEQAEASNHTEPYSSLNFSHRERAKLMKKYPNTEFQNNVNQQKPIATKKQQSTTKKEEKEEATKGGKKRVAISTRKRQPPPHVSSSSTSPPKTRPKRKKKR